MTRVSEEAIQCPCECGIQNVEHVMSECEYMVVYLDEMIDTADNALQSEPKAAQRKWLMAQNVGEPGNVWLLSWARR